MEDTETVEPDLKYWHHNFRRQPKHDSLDVVWGLLFIFVGMTLFFNSIGIVSWNIWPVIISYWPLLLVLAGVQIILGRGPGSSLIVTVLALFVLVSIWTKGLTVVNSPIVEQWSLNHLPWYNWLVNYTPKFKNY